MKRILILGDVNSVHIEKWATGLADKGFRIGVFGLRKLGRDWINCHPNIVNLNTEETKVQYALKISYLASLPKLKRAIAIFKPDIVHAHYATSYGLLANMSGFRPYFISAWGTDVMKFPEGNFIKQQVLKSNFKNAALLFATSYALKEYVSKITSKKVEVIPFGVDVELFKPRPEQKSNANAIVIGCIKSLEKIYSIDVVIQAFVVIIKKFPDLNLKLLIVGEGSEKKNLEDLCRTHGVAANVTFAGKVPPPEVVKYLNETDIFINVSHYESFGVSVIEAMACEKPVVVTNVGGLKEIVSGGEDGLLVPVNDVDATASALEKLIRDKELRLKMGKKGRLKVLEKYNWSENLESMSAIYANFKP